MENSWEIIKRAKKEMQRMLSSIYMYNSNFILKGEEKELLDRVLFSMSVIDRKYFYHGEMVYIDNALPIGEGQTISQPSTVARMLFLLNLKQGDNVLEIGTGSGWNASLLSFLAYPGRVISIDRFESLVKNAEKNLSGLRNYLKQKKPNAYEKLEKINFFAESIFDRKKAWKRKYDRIIITAGIKQGDEEKIGWIAKGLLKQNGRLICPYISGPIIIYEKKGGLKKSKTKEEYVFVPLI